MEVLKKILNIVIDIFIVLVVIISAIIAIISLSSKEDGVPEIFGYVPLTVQSESMSPTFEEGDMIVGKAVNATFDFKEGDVITYWMDAIGEDGVATSVLNTHRITKIEVKDGLTYLTTKGDFNPDEDRGTTEAHNVVAVWSEGGNDAEGIRVEKLGSVLSFLRKPSGFFIAVLLPMAIFFIYELVRFITNLLNYNKEKSKEAALEAAKELLGDDSSDNSGLSEEQKAQAILDYLEKQKADQADAPPVEESPKAEETEQSAMDTTAAVTDPEQEETVSEASED